MLYQFVINGTTWETTGDRTWQFAGTNAVVLPTAFLNNVTSLGPLTNRVIAPATLELSWQAGPRVRLQSAPTVTGPWQDVPDTAGQGNLTVPLGPSQQFFRLIGP